MTVRSELMGEREGEGSVSMNDQTRREYLDNQNVRSTDLPCYIFLWTGS